MTGMASVSVSVGLKGAIVHLCVCVCVCVCVWVWVWVCVCGVSACVGVIGLFVLSVSTPQDGAVQPRPMSSVRGAGYSQRGNTADEQEWCGSGCVWCVQESSSFLACSPSGRISGVASEGPVQGPCPPTRG